MHSHQGLTLTVQSGKYRAESHYNVTSVKDVSLLNLFFVNRQICLESRRAFYKSRDFCFGYSCHTPVLTCLAFLEDRPWAWGSIRSIYIKFRGDRDDAIHANIPTEKWKELCNILVQCPLLHTLRLTCEGHGPDFATDALITGPTKEQTEPSNDDEEAWGWVHDLLQLSGRLHHVLLTCNSNKPW